VKVLREREYNKTRENATGSREQQKKGKRYSVDKSFAISYRHSATESVRKGEKTPPRQGRSHELGLAWRIEVLSKRG